MLTSSSNTCEHQCGWGPGPFNSDAHFCAVTETHSYKQEAKTLVIPGFEIVTADSRGDRGEEGLTLHKIC